MNDAKEEIRARLPVEEVVGQYLELKRAGRNLKGHSPWGVDKTPSFMVSPEKGIWHDFSANKGGDIFSFVMEVEGISFREALEKLAQQAGVELSKYSMGDKKVAQKKARLREALEWATKFYQVCLAKNRPVCEYVFYNRNLNRETVKDFRIGYAPRDGRALLNFLQKKGYTGEEIKDAGLLNQYGGDLFRGRMMIPFIDGSGVIGYTARILDAGEPKYLNTPETLLFNKGRFIFGFAQAKEFIRKSGFVVIVEGNMDVISSHQAGVKEAVATSGTAMTEMHLKQLSRMTDDIRLAYDGDAAGIKAAERAINLAGNLGINLSVISGYGDAKDPDELIQKDPKLWQDAVGEREPAVEWLLNKYEEDLDLTTGPGKKQFSDIAVRVINYINDPVEKKHYQQLVAKKLDVSLADVQAKKFSDSPRRRYKEIKAAPAQANTLRVLEDNLLAILIYGGGVNSSLNLDIPSDDARLAELEMIFENRYHDWDKPALAQEAKELEERLKKEQVSAQISELEQQLAAAEDDPEATKTLMRQIISLQKSIK